MIFPIKPMATFDSCRVRGHTVHSKWSKVFLVHKLDSVLMDEYSSPSTFHFRRFNLSDFPELKYVKMYHMPIYSQYLPIYHISPTSSTVSPWSHHCCCLNPRKRSSRRRLGSAFAILRDPAVLEASSFQLLARDATETNRCGKPRPFWRSMTMGIWENIWENKWLMDNICGNH